MEVFNVYWNKTNENEKYIVGYLVKDDKWIYKYSSNILQIIELGFRPFPELADIHVEYVSEELFKTFSNRIIDISYLKNTDCKLITDNIKVLYKKGNKNAKN